MDRSVDMAGSVPRQQVRLLAAGAMISVVLLGVSLGVILGGLNDPEAPRMPSFGPGQTPVPGMPSSSPSAPALPTQLPTSLPTGLRTSLPTDLPSLPGDLP